MERKRVLLVDSDPESRQDLPRAMGAQAPDVAVEAFGRISEALSCLTKKDFDAAVCCANSADELSFLIRIKKRKPDLPLVLLSRLEGEEIESLAEAVGADAVVRPRPGLQETSTTLLRVLALETSVLAREHRAEVRRTAGISRDLRLLTAANRKLIQEALGNVAPPRRRRR